MAATRSPAAHGPKKQLPGLGLAMLAVIALQVGLQPVLSSKFITKDVVRQRPSGRRLFELRLNCPRICAMSGVAPDWVSREPFVSVWPRGHGICPCGSRVPLA